MEVICALRCRSTSPISANEAPPRSMRTASASLNCCEPQCGASTPDRANAYLTIEPMPSEPCMRPRIGAVERSNRCRSLLTGRTRVRDTLQWRYPRRRAWAAHTRARPCSELEGDPWSQSQSPSCSVMTSLARSLSRARINRMARSRRASGHPTLPGRDRSVTMVSTYFIGGHLCRSRSDPRAEVTAVDRALGVLGKDRPWQEAWYA